MTDWQDIETAPHDTQFLGVRIEEGHEPVYWLVKGLQIRYDREANLLGKGFRWNSRDGMYNVRLTHWQPLPAPPTGLASNTPDQLPAAPYPDEQQQPYSDPNSGPSRTAPDR